VSLLQFVADHQHAFEVKRLCEIVEVSRSSFKLRLEGALDQWDYVRRWVLGHAPDADRPLAARSTSTVVMAITSWPPRKKKASAIPAPSPRRKAPRSSGGRQ
jgi:hypothetical protein